MTVGLKESHVIITMTLTVSSIIKIVLGSILVRRKWEFYARKTGGHFIGDFAVSCHDFHDSRNKTQNIIILLLSKEQALYCITKV